MLTMEQAETRINNLEARVDRLDRRAEQQDSAREALGDHLRGALRAHSIELDRHADLLHEIKQDTERILAQLPTIQEKVAQLPTIQEKVDQIPAMQVKMDQILVLLQNRG